MYKNKHNEHGTITRNKLRLVVQVYNEEKGIDYDKTFSPTGRLKAIKILIVFAT